LAKSSCGGSQVHLPHEIEKEKALLGDLPLTHGNTLDSVSVRWVSVRGRLFSFRGGKFFVLRTDTHQLLTRVYIHLAAISPKHMKRSKNQPKNRQFFANSFMKIMSSLKFLKQSQPAVI
jgi:hypothetical protein